MTHPASCHGTVAPPADARAGSKWALWLWGARNWLRNGRPDVALAYLGGLGDELLCTAAVVESLRRGARNVWIRTRRPELFAGLDARAHVFPDDPRYDRLAARLGRPFRYLAYSEYDAANDRDSPPARHIIALICHRAGIRGSIGLRPHWRVTAAEKAAADSWHGHVVVQTSTLDAHVPMLNKQWPAANFQELANLVSGRVPFVQLGSPRDPPVRGAADLRGRTSVRESAAILAAARGFVGPVGFLMHLARAVECPAVIIYGGRETPDRTGYSCNINLASMPACSPCWQRSRCDHDRVCLSAITASEAAAALDRLLERQPGPLFVDTTEV